MSHVSYRKPTYYPKHMLHKVMHKFIKSSGGPLVTSRQESHTPIPVNFPCILKRWVSHVAWKDGFRWNPGSHSWGYYFIKLTYHLTATITPPPTTTTHTVLPRVIGCPIRRVMHDHLFSLLILLLIILRLTNINKVAYTSTAPHWYTHRVPQLSDFVPLNKE